MKGQFHSRCQPWAVRLSALAFLGHSLVIYGTRLTSELDAHQ
jgi:hypothetical protein